MKLQSQLNLAFTTLLLVTLSVTGILIYSLILSVLIQDEERQLEQKGELLVSVLNEEFDTVQNIYQFNDFLQEQDLHLLVFNRNQKQVLYSTMSHRIVEGFIDNNNFTGKSKSLWEFGSDKYVTSKILIYPESSGLELILLTPLNDLEVVRKSFIESLFIVFLIGALVAVILSYLLTNKLVTPLSRLKRQLKKIEKRQFDDIERIQATGEIKEVEQSIYEMANELQHYMKSQQAFFQNASHELKTPLMTIQGYAEGIRDHVFDDTDSEKGLEIMVTEVKRLKNIINEMILLAKLDSEQAAYKPKDVNINDIIEQVYGRTLPLTNEYEVELKTEVAENATLFIDEEQFLRALLNITINGIRYAKSMVKITVKAENTAIIIIIEDDGEGIDKELLPHLFHRFVKGKNGVTGLGLAISRAIVEQSGGTIRAMDSKLGGAKFVLTFIK